MDSNISTPLPKNYKVGNYVIDKIIGKGGIGSVYLAHHEILHYPTAVKVHEFFPNDENVGKAFLESANYLSQLHHPNIIQLYDYGFVDNKGYMAMEYIDGTTLFDLIPNNQTKEWTAWVIQLFVQLLSAIRYSHNILLFKHDGRQKRGVIHGDIKPHNIFVNKNDGILKLSDFMVPYIQVRVGGEGLLGNNADEDHLHKNIFFDDWGDDLYYEPSERLHSRVFGTPEYMSPEQWEGKLSVVTDVFTIGGTLYQTLTGLPPKALYDGVTPRQVNPYLPKWVEFVVDKAMQKKPEDRFQSVAEIEAIFLESIHRTPSNYNVISELVIGDKVEIEIGDITNQQGQVFIGKFNQVISDLYASGKNETAEAIKVVKEAIMSSKHLSQEEKQEYIEVVNQIGGEASKPKPNKTLLKTLEKGLLVALQTVPDLIKAIAAIELFISK